MGYAQGNLWRSDLRILQSTSFLLMVSVFSDSDRSPHVPNDRDIVVGGNPSPTTFLPRFPRGRFDSVLRSEIEEPLQQGGTNLSRSCRSSEAMDVKGRMRRMGTRSNRIVDSGSLDLPISPIAFFLHKVRSV